MFEDYLKSLKKTNRKILHNEYGFITYAIFSNECRIEDCFIVDKHRNDGKFKEMYNEIENYCKKYNIKYLTTHSTLDNKKSIEVSCSLGFKIKEYKNNYVYLIKELL
jgi:hypothetical protein